MDSAMSPCCLSVWTKNCHCQNQQGNANILIRIFSLKSCCVDQAFHSIFDIHRLRISREERRKAEKEQGYHDLFEHRDLSQSGSQTGYFRSYCEFATTFGFVLWFSVAI